ncbi:uncharacterized protein [Ptychodera flava]|uniref:uncharacterized protein n=1 Tax=Ptychodera flava TaxID=63121 RepID=UPI00396AA84F
MADKIAGLFETREIIVDADNQEDLAKSNAPKTQGNSLEKPKQQSDKPKSLSGEGEHNKESELSSRKCVLILNDEWGTAKGGISTVIQDMAKEAKEADFDVHVTTVAEPSKDDKNDTEQKGVNDIQVPEKTFAKDKSSTTDLPKSDKAVQDSAQLKNLEVIIGHMQVSSYAAIETEKSEKRVLQFTHAIPAQTDVYKENTNEELKEKEQYIINMAENSEVVFSIGPRIYNYFVDKFNENVVHKQYIPYPHQDFFKLKIKAPYPKHPLQILTFGRFYTGVKKNKEYDIVAKALRGIGEHYVHRRLKLTDTEMPVQGNDRKKQVQGKDTKKQVQRKDTEKKVQDNDTEKKVQGKDTEKQVQGKDTEKQVQRKDTEKKVEGKDTEKQVQGKDTEKQVEGKDTEKEVQGKDTEKQVEGNDTEKQVQRTDTEKQVQDHDTEKQVEGKDTEKQVQGKDTEKQVQRKDTEKQVQDNDTEKQVQGKDTEKQVQRKDTEKKVQSKGTEKKVQGKDTAKQVQSKDKVKKVWKHAGGQDYLSKYSQTKFDRYISNPWASRTRIIEHMKESDLFIMPSRNEPFGMAGMEAIAAGLPVLITKQSGLAEFIEKHFDTKDTEAIIVDITKKESWDSNVDFWRKHILEAIVHIQQRFKVAARMKEQLKSLTAISQTHEEFKDILKGN